MSQIELSDAEVTTLQDVLDSYLSELRMEIADTDRMEFREGLKAKKKLLEGQAEVEGGAPGRRGMVLRPHPIRADPIGGV